MHLDRTIRTLFFTHAAADAPIFDYHFSIVAAMNGPNRTSDHTNGVEARTARQWNQVVFETRPFQKKAAPAIIVSVSAGAHTFVTARTAIQINQHQSLALDQSQALKFR